MKILTISRNKLELTRAHLRRPLLTIGRSPGCDVLLRAPGVSAVHFLIEWIGSGHFNPSQGAWAIIDISDSIGGSESGEGLVLSEDAITLGDLVFECVDDPLESFEEIGGRIKDGLSGDAPATDMLEIVQIRADSGAVEDVRHVAVPLKAIKKARAIPGMPRELKVAWDGKSGETVARILLEEMPGAELFSRGARVETEKSFALKSNDLLRVRWKGRDFYVRFVGEVKSPKVPHAVIADPLLRRISLAVISGGITLLLLMKFFPAGEIQTEQPPVRLARIEIPAPPPEPVLKKPEPVPTLAAQTAEQNEVATPQQTPTKAARASKARYKSPESANKSGLNTPSKISDVNAVGILGALGKSNAKGKGVKAERLLNEGLSRPLESASQPKVVLSTPPSGTLGKGDGGSPKGTGQANLSAASTTLSGAGKYNPNSVGPIARKGGDTGVNMGSGIQGKGTGLGGGSEIGTVGAGDFSVQGGGLDRETVRRVIAAYRGEIRTCYERALLSQSQLEGRTVYDWQISAEGGVVKVKVAKSTLNSPRLNLCVQDVIRRMSFPRAANGRSTRVIYPFVFQGRK